MSNRAEHGGVLMLMYIPETELQNCYFVISLTSRLLCGIAFEPIASVLLSSPFLVSHELACIGCLLS